MQLSVAGKCGRVRQVLLPETVSQSLLALRGGAGANDPAFPSRKGRELTERAVNYMLKRAAKRAGTTGAVSPIGCGLLTDSTPSTAARRCPRCRQLSAMPMWRRRVAICTLGRTARAGSDSIRGDFNEERPRPVKAGLKAANKGAIASPRPPGYRERPDGRCLPYVKFRSPPLQRLPKSFLRP